MWAVENKDLTQKRSEGNLQDTNEDSGMTAVPWTENNESSFEHGDTKNRNADIVIIMPSAIVLSFNLNDVLCQNKM